MMFQAIRRHVNVPGFLASLALGFAALLAFSAGVAQAEAPRLVFDGTLSSEGLGVAVDQASGDVLTAGLIQFKSDKNLESVALGHVNSFDATGKLISPPSPFGEEGFYSGAAVNQANGEVYVLDALNSAIDTYNPSTGELLSSFAVPKSHNLEGVLSDVQIGADSAGNVYVPVDPENEVLEYSPAGVLLQTFKGSGAAALKEPTGVAVDSSGNVWVADNGKNRIVELSGAGAFMAEIKSEGVQSVALDSSGDIFALDFNSADFCGAFTSPCGHLLEYSSSGAQLADIGAGDFSVDEGQSFGMVAVDDSSGRVYVTDAAKNTAWIFAPPAAPRVSNELVADVGTTEAKLGALVSPGGIPTSYRFEYGTTGEYGHTTPFPEGSVGQEGFAAHTVWAAASGLALGATYHYRVVVTNELGTEVGPDQTFTTETTTEASCPNETLRTGFSANLPDCRAYEIVTPPNSASAEPDTEAASRPAAAGGADGNYSARTGERMTYRTVEAMPGADSSGYDYLATRGADGWHSEDLIPLQSYTGDRCSQANTNGDEINAYSAELTTGVLRVGGGENWGTSQLTGGCGAQGLEVVAGEPLGVENLLLRDNITGEYRLINAPPAGVTPTDATFLGASADLSHVIFSENSPLTANAPAGVKDLYEWDAGVLRLVTVLPNGTAVAGSLANVPDGYRAVSTDGTHVFFTAGGKLYVRINGEQTVQLDEARGGAGPGGGGALQDVSADGSQAFFTDEASAGLTSDTVAGSGTNLYRYANGDLTDLTPAEHAEVGQLLGISEDGSYVYFSANGVLPGAGANHRGETAQSGHPNIYVWHGGAASFIATIEPTDAALESAVQVSANGDFFAFTSKVSLTDYDNTDVSSGSRDSEIFLYDAASDQLICVSCNPSGEAPAAGGTTLPGSSVRYDVSNEGRVFFETQEALLPRDTNHQTDVYEYEQGRLSLISSGVSSSRSLLLAVSETGDDVFFLSRQSLVAQDSATEALVIYDARVGGGFPPSVSPPACTTADACRTPVSPQPSIFGAPASATFSGAGNLTPSPAISKKIVTKKSTKCADGQKVEHGKCARAKTKHRKKKAKKATNNRRAGR